VSDVFISYSQPDGDCAHEMVARLEAQGVKCWIAPRDIAPSADWAAEIIDAIAAARVMVLIFSASTNQSPQVRREVERAVHKGVNILPFRIEDVLPSKSLEFFLSAQHWMDAFPPPREQYYERLCSYLKTQLSPLAIGAPPPSAAPRASAPPATAGSGAHAFGGEELLHIEAQLAGYIGPLAKHLVRRAALRATGVEDLITRLVTELDAESDRIAFVQRCRMIPASKDRAGDRRK
jgi:TIR domain